MAAFGVLLASPAFAPATQAAGAPEGEPAVRLPAAARVISVEAYARAAPSGRSPIRMVLRPTRADLRPTIVLVDRRRRDALGRLWYRALLARRPNGTTGWIAADRLRLRHRSTRIVIRRRARTLTVLRAGRAVVRTRVAIGRPGSETPVGRFYVTARFRPSRRYPYLGAYAFETSAYSRRSDWPGGGIVGIHGTDRPDLLGRRVSSGCIRVANRAILRLRRLVTAGTPVRVLR